MAKKTSCPVTRAEFVQNAKPVTVMINTQSLTAAAREFATGSFGWYLNSKAEIEVGGKMVTVQIGMNLIVVGSKELPREDAKPV